MSTFRSVRPPDAVEGTQRAAVLDFVGGAQVQTRPAPQPAPDLRAKAVGVHLAPALYSEAAGIAKRDRRPLRHVVGRMVERQLAVERGDAVLVELTDAQRDALRALAAAEERDVPQVVRRLLRPVLDALDPPGGAG